MSFTPPVFVAVRPFWQGMLQLCCPHPDYITNPAKKPRLDAVARQGGFALCGAPGNAGEGSRRLNARFDALWEKLTQTR